MLNVPLLGKILMPIGVSPFQISNVNANLGVPIFTTKLFVNDYSRGYWGLTSLYTSINPWNTTGTVALTGNIPSIVVQVAGSSINSFGIFDYDGTLANPAQFNPVRTDIIYASGGNYYNGCSYLGEISLLSGTVSGNTLLQDFQIVFPTLAFVNTKSATAVVTRNQYPVSNVVNTNTFANGGAPCVDFLTLKKYTSFRAIKDNGGGSANLLYSTDSQTLPLDTPKVITGQNGFVTILSTNFMNPLLTLANPVSGNMIVTVNSVNGSITVLPGAGGGFQPYATNLFTTVGQVPVFNPIILSNVVDQASFKTIPNTSACMVPGGGFLMWVGNANANMLLIKADFSGYYQIVLQPKTPAANSAIAALGGAAGFGSDLNGNLWFGDNTGSFLPVLYSSLSLGASLTLNINPLFDVSAGAFGCRVLGNATCEVWEG